jgi:hypothetical protein
MKTINLSLTPQENRTNRVDVIESLLLISSHYTCGNVLYNRTDSRVVIFSKDEKKEFYATELVTYFSAFSTFFQFNSETRQVELIVF